MGELKSYRQAYLRLPLSRIADVVDPKMGLKPKNKCPDCWVMEFGLENLRVALGLPDDCRVVGVSRHVHFKSMEAALLVESGDFRLVKEGTVIPLVMAEFVGRQFMCWTGDAALCGDYVPHHRRKP